MLEAPLPGSKEPRRSRCCRTVQVSMLICRDPRGAHIPREQLSQNFWVIKPRGHPSCLKAFALARSNPVPTLSLALLSG